MSLSVTYVDVPAGAQESAIVETSNSQPFGNAEQIATGVQDLPLATLEPHGWTLDGSRELFPDLPVDVGWWSKNRTEEDGRFLEPPVISIRFPEVYTSSGITFTFWPSMGHWCNEVLATWYNGDIIISQQQGFPDNGQWTMVNAVEGFDRIEIQLIGTNFPLNFAKIQKIQIGHVIVFLQDEITRVSLLNEIDPSLCELSTDTMTVEIFEKRGFPLIPQKNQEMRLYRNGEQIAVQYIAESSREGQRFFKFQCQSAIGRLEDDFYGGVYNDYPLKNLLSDVLTGFSFNLDDAFQNQTVTGYLPVCTKREALQQIMFAIGAVVSTQKDGIIKISEPEETVTGSFGGGDVFPGASISREAQIASVKLFVHRFSPGSETDTLLNEEPINGENVLYIFSEPHHSYNITGGVISDSGENWVRITASENVTLTAKKYVHSTSVRSMINRFATAADKSNIVTVEDATLIHSGNAEKTLMRLFSYYTMRIMLSEDAVINGQFAGQIVDSTNPWGTVTSGYITKMESEFTSTGHTAKLTVRGTEKSSEV